MKKGNYSNPMSLTQQCKFCGNPFRIDTYKGCTFGCNYCFSNTRSMQGNWGADGLYDYADLDKLKRQFKEAFSNNKLTNINLEMLRNKVPLHCGGMSDPFQDREFNLHITYELIKLSKEYRVPITFSTKQHYLPEEYWEILDPELHAFQVSLIGLSKEFVGKYETRTGEPQLRLNFLKELKERGFWTGMRIQPLIDLEEAKKLTQYASENHLVNYITIEHLKIPMDNKEARELFKDVPNIELYLDTNAGGRGRTANLEIKLNNFKAISEIANKYGVKVGVGDNDLHFLSQSRNCCGIDTIPSNEFKNWYKYNLTYFITSKDDISDFNDLWIPNNLYNIPFRKRGNSERINLKDYIDRFIIEHPHLIPEDRPDLKKHFNLSVRKKLF